MSDRRIQRLEMQLASAPTTVRGRMLADAETLRPGAASVVGRFFAVLAARSEAVPSRAAFDAAARSEPTLHTLLTALDRYAPELNLAAGREARKAWYRERPRSVPPLRLSEASPKSGSLAWPEPWRALYPGLEKARPSLSAQTFRRYLASIDRCAAIVSEDGLRPDLDRFLAYSLMEAFRERGLTHATCVSYLGGIEALARLGGIEPARLRGIREIVKVAQSRMRRSGRRKDVRIAAFHEAGGYERIAAAVLRLRDEAALERAWSAVAERKLQAAAILALVMNNPARGGDLAGWRLGHELVREPGGRWTLAWTQHKTGFHVDAGGLWPEVCELLDELLCRGRPQRLACVLYASLLGVNWLTHAQSPSGGWASRLVRQAIGLPLHDVRTLAADYLRRHDPNRGADIAGTLLGHRHAASTTPYRSLAEGVAAARRWRDLRRTVTGVKRRGYSAPIGAKPEL